MELTHEWVEALKVASSRKVILATLALGATAEDFVDRHPAEFSGVIRCSTHPDVNVADSAARDRPFWPTLLSWPDIDLSWRPEERSAATAATKLVLSSNAKLPTWTDTLDGTAGYARVELWTDGIPLDRAIPLIAGPFTIERQDRRTSSATFNVVDGVLDRENAATAGTIEVDQFPDAPVGVRGVGQRKLALGVYPVAGLELLQIDSEGLIFYAHDGVATVSPTVVKLGDVAVTSAFRVRTRITPDGTPYTAVEFVESPWQTAARGVLACMGGRGLETPSPILTLLEDFAGYALTPRARYALRSMSIQQDVLLRQPADVFLIARDRLLPQTDGVLILRNGLVDVLRWSDPAGEVRMSPGVGLRSRYPTEQQGMTQESAIFNAVEIEYAGGRFSMGPDSGGAIGTLCAASASKWGLRILRLTGDRACRDLSDLVDVRLVAESLLEVTAMQHKMHAYSCTWLGGLMLDLNSRVLLTDENEQLDELPTRVVRWKLPATGPRVYLQSEDGIDA